MQEIVRFAASVLHRRGDHAVIFPEDSESGCNGEK